MQIYKTSSVIKTKKDIVLHYIKVIDDLYVFKLDVAETITRSGLDPITKNHSKQGFTKTGNLDKYLYGETLHLKDDDSYLMVNKEILEDLRTNILANIPRIDPFDKYVQDNASNEYIIKGKDGIKFFLDDRVVPVALHFEYIQSNMDNMHYDLELAVEILKKNSQVTLITDRYDKSFISDIPSYNASPSRTKCISFIFSPTIEQATMLWEEQKKIDEKYPHGARFKAVLDLDLLGLHSGGACKTVSNGE